MLSATAYCRWQGVPVICQHCHLTKLYYCIYSACGSYRSLEFGQYVAWGNYWSFPILLSPKTPSAWCNSAVSTSANSWLCSHVIFPAIALGGFASCCPHRGFNGCEKNVKIFETRKIISKRIIPKVQLPIAKIEFETYIFWQKRHESVVVMT